MTPEQLKHLKNIKAALDTGEASIDAIEITMPDESYPFNTQLDMELLSDRNKSIIHGAVHMAVFDQLRLENAVTTSKIPT